MEIARRDRKKEQQDKSRAQCLGLFVGQVALGRSRGESECWREGQVTPATDQPEGKEKTQVHGSGPDFGQDIQTVDRLSWPGLN